MAGSIFKVGVTIALYGNMVTGLDQIGRRLQTATTLTKGLNAQVAGLQTRMMMGGAIAGFGIAGLGYLTKSVEASAQFQMTMARTLNMFKLTTDAAAAFKREVFDISHATIFSADNIADVALGLKQVGLTFNQIRATLWDASRAGEILYRVAGISPNTTGRVTGEFAHVFGIYDVSGVQKMLKTLVDVSQVIPGGPQSLVTMAGYMKSTQLLGFDPAKTIQIMAFAQQQAGGGGGGARGGLSGAALANYFQGAAGVGTTVLRPWQNILGRGGLGLVGPGGDQSAIMTGGAFDPFKIIARTQQAYKLAASGIAGEQLMVRQALAAAQGHMTAKQLQEFETTPQIASVLRGQYVQPGAFFDLLGQLGFGKTGLRPAAAFAQPATAQQFGIYQGMMAGAPSIWEQQNTFLNTLLGRWQQFTTDMYNLDILIGDRLNPTMTKWIANIDRLVFAAGSWASAHPERLTKMVEGFAALSAGATVTGGFMVLSSLMKLFGIVSASAGVGTVLVTLGEFLLRVSLIGGAIYLVVEHWKAFTGLLQKYPNIAWALTTAFDKLKTGFMAIYDWANKVAATFIKIGVIPAFKMFMGMINDLAGAFRAGPGTPMPKSKAYEDWKKGWGFFGPTPPDLHHSPAYEEWKKHHGFFGSSFGGAGGGVHIEHVDLGGIHFAGGIAPGEEEKVAERILTALNRRLHGSLIATPHGGGVFESPFLHVSTV